MDKTHSKGKCTHRKQKMKRNDKVKYLKMKKKKIVFDEFQRIAMNAKKKK